ncbi:MAG: sigma 54-interacting transcriptional regulator [Desulfovibrio sp.]|uniref:sigma 54-interacting transcriptional regulator n=1 Tax=Desulfovibrio sp. 7SRBS1 TaxID=3378064 RepID=UPI003B3ECE61
MVSAPKTRAARFPFGPLTTFRNYSMTTKLMITLIPCVVVILMTTGIINYKLSHNFIDIALERTVILRNLALTNEVENYLERCKQDLLFMAALSPGEPLTAEDMRAFLLRTRQSGGNEYCEFAYISPDSGNHIFLVAKDGIIQQVGPKDMGAIHPNPLLFIQGLPAMKPGEVLPSSILQVEYPFPTENNINNRISSQVIRFITPYTMPGSKHPGYLILAISVVHIRDLLSLHNSPQSPVWAHPRSNEVRYYYMVDTEGWILFQSEEVNQKGKELTTYQARSGYDGTLGKPGLPSAFRPNSIYKPFWNMIDEIKSRQSGLEKVRDEPQVSRKAKDYYFAYAPVTFTPGKNDKPIVLGGLCFVDRSQLNVSAGYRFLDVMFIITLVATILLSLLIFGVSRVITGPLLKLSKAVTTIRSTGRLEPIDQPDRGFEMSLLKNAINAMITTVKKQLEEIRLKDETILNVNLQEKAPLEEEMLALADDLSMSLIPEIMGVGPKISSLKSDILKAAQVDVDVLVMGETGTGKQLTADAIHNHSKRASRPFISINCGALDENLLLDALFGHIKGAFTEARTDRKGAFAEAHGGTLFLDEIQSASPKVQQALLRAISIRKIKPLGSDKEVDVNVRLIAATNADLKELIDQGEFREDLYFRLKVVTIQTPPLREHKESIPILSMHFLRQAEPLVNKKDLGLSKGALEKLKLYAWPGNIRELLNTITRAVVMTENDIIQASEIRLEGEGTSSSPLEMTPTFRPVSSESTKTPDEIDSASLEDEPPFVQKSSEAEEMSQEMESASGAVRRARDPQRVDFPAASDHATERGRHGRENTSPPVHDAASSEKNVSSPRSGPVKLSPRQQKAYAEILRRGEVTRGQYQKAVGGNISSRTAIYDLQDMVQKGLLEKTGQGPATKYILIKRL